jgi:hypothetical protein
MEIKTINPFHTGIVLYQQKLSDLIAKLLKITQMLIFSYFFYIVGADRFRVFFIYITDTFDGEHPNMGHLCYHDQQTGYPSTLQNITCDYPGRYVVIYNERCDF